MPVDGDPKSGRSGRSIGFIVTQDCIESLVAYSVNSQHQDDGTLGQKWFHTIYANRFTVLQNCLEDAVEERNPQHGRMHPLL